MGLKGFILICFIYFCDCKYKFGVVKFGFVFILGKFFIFFVIIYILYSVVVRIKEIFYVKCSVSCLEYSEYLINVVELGY